MAAAVEEAMTAGGGLECVATLAGHEERVWHAAWSLDGSLLASCSSDRSVRIWQRGRSEGSWAEVSKLDDAHERTVRSVDWSPCGRFLAAVSFDGTCCVWRRSEGDSDFEGDAEMTRDARTLEWEIIATLEGHENEVKGAAWNASATLLATCGRDKSVWLWEFADDESFELVSVLHGHGGDVKAVCFDHCSSLRDDDLLASCSYDDTIKLWGDDGDDWSCRATLEGHASTVWDVRFAAARDGARRLVSCGADRTLRVWVEGGAHEWTEAANLDGAHARCVYSCDVVGPGPTRVATAAGDNTIALSAADDDDPATLAHVATVQGAHDGDVNSIRFSPGDPTVLATAGDDAFVKIWKWRGGP